MFCFVKHIPSKTKNCADYKQELQTKSNENLVDQQDDKEQVGPVSSRIIVLGNQIQATSSSIKTTQAEHRTLRILLAISANVEGQKIIIEADDAESAYLPAGKLYPTSG